MKFDAFSGYLTGPLKIEKKENVKSIYRKKRLKHFPKSRFLFIYFFFGF